ncbi:acyltransferase [Bacteroides ovatus]|jgi:acetyltransferase-like isoleucine patch superfamily enzyme|uniref:acyltransferase n=2 Tax=Bacteroidales TaxID=171549 RepID=UPI0014025A6C|nr:acyltransferase [Bacteroides ovatus]MDC2674342.1 acyltransferase [Bacteroides ovatus]
MLKRIYIFKLYRLPKKIQMRFYILWNKVQFWLNDIEFGTGMKVHNVIYLSKHPEAKVAIGQNFIMTSGEAFNPLCRNIRASICLERPTSVLEIGDDTGLSSPCIWVKEHITIGSRVKVGGDCIIMDSDAHNLDYRIRASKELIDKISKDALTAKTSPIVIEDDVLIGMRCIILKGVTVGARSVIGSGSIVTKSIPSDCIAAGNPCKVIRLLNV